MRHWLEAYHFGSAFKRCFVGKPWFGDTMTISRMHKSRKFHWIECLKRRSLHWLSFALPSTVFRSSSLSGCQGEGGSIEVRFSSLILLASSYRRLGGLSLVPKTSSPAVAQVLKSETMLQAGSFLVVCLESHGLATTVLGILGLFFALTRLQEMSGIMWNY